MHNIGLDCDAALLKSGEDTVAKASATIAEALLIKALTAGPNSTPDKNQVAARLQRMAIEATDFNLICPMLLSIARSF